MQEEKKEEIKQERIPRKGAKEGSQGRKEFKEGIQGRKEAKQGKKVLVALMVGSVDGCVGGGSILGSGWWSYGPDLPLRVFTTNWTFRY